MFLGYFTSSQLLKQKKNKVGEMKKKRGRNVSCICYQGEREGSGMISYFNCLFEFPFKWNLDDAIKEETQNVKNPGKP